MAVMSVGHELVLLSQCPFPHASHSFLFMFSSIIIREINEAGETRSLQDNYGIVCTTDMVETQNLKPQVTIRYVVSLPFPFTEEGLQSANQAEFRTLMEGTRIPQMKLTAFS